MFECLSLPPQQLAREAESFPKFGNSPGSTLFPSYPPSSPFGMLQQQAAALQQQQQQQGSSRDRDSADDLGRRAELFSTSLDRTIPSGLHDIMR